MKHPQLPIPWWEPRSGELELSFLDRVLKSHYLNEGSTVEEFEEEIKKLTGAKFAHCCSSGTAALFLALKSCGIGPSDEVLVPDITFIATANAVSLTGATPVLVDVLESNLTMDPKKAEEAITPRTKAIVPVHVSGRACDMKAILSLAKKRSLKIVEDAAEAWNSFHQDKHLGTLGDFGCLSLSPNKTLTTGQGGVLLTNDEKLSQLARALKDQGRPTRGTGGDDTHPSIGYNFKFTNVQAAIGLAQLHYLEQRTARIRRHWEIYSKELKSIPNFRFLGFKEREAPQWVDTITPNRNLLEAHLKANQIGTRRFWHPLHTQKPYKASDKNFPVATRLAPQALWLPSAYTLNDDAILYTCNQIQTAMTDLSHKVAA